MNIPEREPDSFVAGDTVQWLKALSDYTPADGWVLSYTFVSKSGLFSVAASDNGDGRFLAELSAAESAPILDDTYQWHGIVTLAAARYTIGTGTTQVFPDLAGSPGQRDTRTHEQRTLEAIEAVIEKRATTDQQNYAVGGVSLSRMPIADLMTLKDRYKAMVLEQERKERMRKGLGHPSQVVVYG